MTIDVMSMAIVWYQMENILLTSDIQFSPRICFSMAENKKVSKIVDNAIWFEILIQFSILS